MELNLTIRAELLANVPSLRKFALSLCGTIDGADDLVQETLLRAVTHLDSFRPGTNLAAWLMTILRNLFASSIASDGVKSKTWTVIEAPPQSAEALTRCGTRLVTVTGTGALKNIHSLHMATEVK
jgi:DNA-directed RNA polymerase specialized sigma24 family protein